MAPNERQAFEKLAAILRERCGAFDIGLCGSKARGTDTPDSDLDVLALLPETSRKLESRIDEGIIFEINLEHGCHISNVYAEPANR